MRPGLEEEIRTRAYQIWEDEGHPEGRADAHWHQASEELANAAGNRFTGGPDDLDRNPGIGTSAGTTIQNHDEVMGSDRPEGDVLSDTTNAGGIDPGQRGRKNA
jgi:hypothetical protein